MAKVLLPSSAVTFNAAQKKLTFSGPIPSRQGAILSVVNNTRGAILYQPQGGSVYTGTWASPVLTLAASTTGHADGDDLSVWIDDGVTPTYPKTPTTTSISASSTSQLILAANANRKGYSLANLSMANLYLSFSNPATAANCFAELPPHAFIIFDQVMIVPNAIYGIWTGANGTAQVTEYV